MSERVYHDPTLPELEEFEDYLDEHLKPNSELTPDQIRVRDNLIEGVDVMATKIREFRYDLPDELSYQEDCDL